MMLKSLSKADRARLFMERLQQAPACSTAAEALETLAAVIDATEDEFTAW